MGIKYFKEESKTNWSLTTDANYIGDERVKLGCLMRIADATEVMAKRHQELIDENVYLTERNDIFKGEIRVLERKIAGLRGHINRLKGEK